MMVVISGVFFEIVYFKVPCRPCFVKWMREHIVIRNYLLELWPKSLMIHVMPSHEY